MSKKLLQINPVLRTSTSTGRIMKEIGELAMANGWESYVAYSKGRDGLPGSTSIPVPVGNKASVAWHGLQTRILDRHGLGSVLARSGSSKISGESGRTSSIYTTFMAIS